MFDKFNRLREALAGRPLQNALGQKVEQTKESAGEALGNLGKKAADLSIAALDAVKSAAASPVGEAVIGAFPGAQMLKLVSDKLTATAEGALKDQIELQVYKRLMEFQHRTLLLVFWQNLALIASLFPVYWLRSPWPFYLAYVGVIAYTISSLWQSRAMLIDIARKGLLQTLSSAIQKSVDEEVANRSRIEQIAISWVGDTRNLAADVALRIKRDALVLFSNLGVTLVLSFVTFRLFVIPLLETKAMGH